MANEYKPYVDPKETLKELTLPPLILGAIMAIVLGAANVYLGLKAGMTVAATFPAAVLSMAVLKLFKGNILEENIARTTGAVGEALAAGAIFTVPAFVLVGAWGDIELFSREWMLATALLLVGGILGVLLMILLRRTFMEDASLPFPESLACTEIVKAGQGGQSGAGAVFAAMGVAGLVEFFKNGAGVPIIGGHYKGAFKLGADSKGAFPFFTPEPSPAFLAVGYIIGPKYGAIAAAGGIFGWLFLMPVILFMMSQSDSSFATTLNTFVANGNTDALFGGEGSFPGLKAIYGNNVKMIAIGAMIVGAFFTLFKMRSNLKAGLGRSIKAIGGGGGGGGGGGEVLRTDKDINIKFVFFAIVLMLAAMFGLYTVLCKSASVSIVVTIVMAIMSFLFAAVAGFLVSIIGSSSNPISGLTLSTLLIAAGMLVLLGMGGGYEMVDGTKVMSAKMSAGVLAVLGVATVVCCVAGVAGDMAQDWKVGYLLGGTPWRMEVGGFIGVIAAALFLVSVITLLHGSEMKSDFEKGLKNAKFSDSQSTVISGLAVKDTGRPAGLGKETIASLQNAGFSAAQIAMVSERAVRARGFASEVKVDLKNGIKGAGLGDELAAMAFDLAEGVALSPVDLSEKTKKVLKSAEKFNFSDEQIAIISALAAYAKGVDPKARSADFEKGLKEAKFTDDQVKAILGIASKEAEKPAGLDGATKKKLSERSLDAGQIAAVSEKVSHARAVGLEVRKAFAKDLGSVKFSDAQVAMISAVVGKEAGKPAGLSDGSKGLLKAKGLGDAQIALVAEVAIRARGIGGDGLPAPQAGLMATTSKGIISQELPWELILIGMMFAFGLIFVGVPSPMLVAVGMYLPFQTTTAIFAGGVIAWIGTKIAKSMGAKDDKAIEAVNNKGLLVASGFVAGEALMGIILAVLVTANVKIIANPPAWFGAKWLGGCLILGLAAYLISGSLRGFKASK